MNARAALLEILDDFRAQLKRHATRLDQLSAVTEREKCSNCAESHWDIERKLYLPAGSKADAELIVHEPLRGEGIEVQGFLVRACDCHPHYEGLLPPYVIQRDERQ